MIEVVAFDADDTLWHNVPLFADTTDRFRKMLSDYHSPEWIEERLYETETRNLRHYGYGIKSFILSMIETGIELTEGRMQGHEVGEILSFAKRMLQAPVELLDGVEGTISQLARSYQLVVVTKGDIFDQESKLARSGLGEYFSNVEIVREKDRSTYEAIAKRCGVPTANLLMVGDSLKSDVIPVLEAGGHAIHIPYGNPWQYEFVGKDVSGQYEFRTAESIVLVPEIVEGIV
jgi:putative hydrolase of the HAD superfamily